MILLGMFGRSLLGIIIIRVMKSKTQTDENGSEKRDEKGRITT